jgi:hypothetical protein
MKVNISLIMDNPPPPKEKSTPTPSIDERIEYASECIECCSPEKPEALEFLQELYRYLEKIQNPKKGDQKRIEFIRSILENYGMQMPLKGEENA